MRAMLSELARLERLVVVDSLALEAPKTRLLAAKLKELNLGNVLILVEAYDEKLDLASRNLLGVSVLPVSAVDPQSLLAHEHVLATVGAVRMLEEKLA
jgi:large subunit ribosomal protein L4